MLHKRLILYIIFISMQRFDLKKLILKCDSVLKFFQIFYFRKNSFFNIDNYRQWTILLRRRNHRQKEEKWENGISCQMGRVWRSYMGTREEHPQSHHWGVSINSLLYFLFKGNKLIHPPVYHNYIYTMYIYHIPSNLQITNMYMLGSEQLILNL